MRIVTQLRQLKVTIGILTNAEQWTIMQYRRCERGNYFKCIGMWNWTSIEAVADCIQTMKAAARAAGQQQQQKAKNESRSFQIPSYRTVNSNLIISF